ncbi:MAG: hypothetical protein WCP58_02895 [bacterium]
MEVIEIIRQWQANASLRGLANATGLARKTVRKYLQAAEKCGLTRNGPPPSETQLLALVPLNVAGPRQAARPSEDLLEPWALRIRDWILVEHLQLTRIQELLGQQQCAVPYTTLYRYALRQGWLSSHRDTVRMADTQPGEVAEMDFGRLGLMLRKKGTDLFSHFSRPSRPSRFSRLSMIFLISSTRSDPSLLLGRAAS